MESGKRRRYSAPSATPWDGVPESDPEPAQAIVMACHRDIYRYRHAPTSLEGEAAFSDAYERELCPRCGSSRIQGNGHDARGVRRWRCLACGRSFTPTTGTVFDRHRITVADWTEFLLGLLSFESVNAMTRSNRRSATTLPYWTAKLFAVLEGVQGDTVLSGRVEIDETGYPLALADQPRTEKGSLMPGGCSEGKLCVGIGCDGEGGSVFACEGTGKTSGARTLGAFGGHIMPGSTLVHDKENGHSMLVRRLELESEAYGPEALGKLPDKENPLRHVNRPCFLLRTFLNSHSGLDRADIDGYLNLFWVAMNPPEDRMEKAAFMLNRAMESRKTLQYLDLCSTDARPGG